MRADRLVATLLLLQARGTVTAQEVADELEVSERTARRDLDALGMAGVPVYSQQGRGGGWRLIGDATTDLTGLRSPEARALLTMAAATGRATPEFGSAMNKLLQALPEPIRVEAERAAASVVADSTSWTNPSSVQFETRRDEWIEPLQQAVIEHRVVTLTYTSPRSGSSTRRVEPLGLVIKRGSWYLLAHTAAGNRSFRIDRIVEADVLADRFDPPVDFDLDAAWRAITAGYSDHTRQVAVDAVVDDWALGALRAMGVDVTLGSALSDGRTSAVLGAPRVEILGAQLAGLIHSIELIDAPDDLIDQLAVTGAQLVSRFGSPRKR